MMATITALPERLDLSYYQDDTAPLLVVTLSAVTDLVSARFVVSSGLIFDTAPDITIAVVDGNSVISIARWDVTLEPGQYRYDLETTDSAGYVQTWLTGKLLVTQDVG